MKFFLYVGLTFSLTWSELNTKHIKIIS